MSQHLDLYQQEVIKLSALHAAVSKVRDKYAKHEDNIHFAIVADDLSAALEATPAPAGEPITTGITTILYDMERFDDKGSHASLSGRCVYWQHQLAKLINVDYPCPAPPPPGHIAADDVRKILATRNTEKVDMDIAFERGWRTAVDAIERDFAPLIAAAGPQEPVVPDGYKVCPECETYYKVKSCPGCTPVGIWLAAMDKQEPVVPVSVVEKCIERLKAVACANVSGCGEWHKGYNDGAQRALHLVRGIFAPFRHAAKPDAEEPCATCLDKGYTLNPENIRERIPCPDCAAPDAPEPDELDTEWIDAPMGPFVADAPEPLICTCSVCGERYNPSKTVHQCTPAPVTTEQRAAKVCDTAERFMKLQHLAGFHPPKGDLDKEVRKAWCDLANAVRAWLAEGAKGGGE